MNWTAVKANPKTTWSGVIGGVCVILGAIKYSIDSGAGFDFAAFIQSEGVITAIIGIVAGLAVIVNGILGRDADKSSQDSGIRLPVEKKIEIQVEKTVDEALGRK